MAGSIRISVTDFLRNGVYLYIILLFFEGALRKWFLPFLAGPLLVVRDPVALVLLTVALTRGVLRLNLYLLLVGFVTIISALFTLGLGHENLAVTIYGARIFLLHFPLIFLFAALFDRADIERIGHWIILLTPPMTLLIAMQYFSPQSAFVNRGIGGDIAGGGFSGAAGFFRPPGTFSFTTGTKQFFSLAACFIAYFFVDANARFRWSPLILSAAAVGLLAAVPLSISRGLLFQLAIIAFFVVIAAFRKPQTLFRIGGIAILGVIALLGLSQLGFFQTSVEVLLIRFENANASEGGTLEGTIGERLFGSIFTAISGKEGSPQPFWGYGLGLGTNVGSQLLTGSRQFLVAENEWGRVIGEMGLLLGLLIMLVRSFLAVHLSFLSFAAVGRGNALPWLLMATGIPLLVIGQWAQPTSLGFVIVTIGLAAASLWEDSPVQMKQR